MTNQSTFKASASFVPFCKGENMKDGKSEARRKPPKVKSPLSAIRAKCYDCTCGHIKEIELCSIIACPLYLFRFGKRPATVARQGMEVRHDPR